MFAGINVCVFETKPYSWGLIFAVSSGLVNYLGTHELCLRVFTFAILNRSRNSPDKSLANSNEFTVDISILPLQIAVSPSRFRNFVLYRNHSLLAYTSLQIFVLITKPLASFAGI